MPNSGFSVDLPSVTKQLEIIEADIDEISDIIKKIYEKMLDLDDSKWKGKEKDKIDNQYMPYLNKLDQETNGYLKSYVAQIKESIEMFNQADIDIKNTASSIKDIK